MHRSGFNQACFLVVLRYFNPVPVTGVLTVKRVGIVEGLVLVV